MATLKIQIQLQLRLKLKSSSVFGLIGCHWAAAKQFGDCVCPFALPNSLSPHLPACLIYYFNLTFLCKGHINFAFTFFVCLLHVLIQTNTLRACAGAGGELGLGQAVDKQIISHFYDRTNFMATAQGLADAKLKRKWGKFEKLTATISGEKCLKIWEILIIHRDTCMGCNSRACRDKLIKFGLNKAAIWYRCGQFIRYEIHMRWDIR